MCLFPQKVIMYEVVDELTGEVKKQFMFRSQDKIEEVFDKLKYDNKEIIEVPCNKCLECFEQKAKEWSFRIEKECQKFAKNCFITLTYENSPGSLNKRDFQLFLKRLRKSVFPLKIRYFGCGEYGSKGLRPHYHFIIFNYMPDDCFLLKYDHKGFPIYVSDKLAKLWGKGFISVQEANVYNAKYCAKYMQKFIELPDDFVKPFVCMSTHPGIGYDYFFENRESLLITDKLYSKGYYIKLPRYFEKLAIKNGDVLAVNRIHEERKNKFVLSKNLIDLENKRLKYELLFDKLKVF